MSRPYFRHSVQQLEEEFEKHKANLSIVRALCAELDHRTTQRALRLRGKIDAHLKVLIAPVPTAAAVPPASRSNLPTNARVIGRVTGFDGVVCDVYEDPDGRQWIAGSTGRMYGLWLPKETKQAVHRGYRRPRYRYPRSTKNSVAGRAVVSRLYGGIDDDVRRLFFALDSFTLMLVFNDYERKYGEGKRKYAEETFAKWRSGSVQMGGEISERLIRIVPRFLNFEQKYELIEKLWGRFRQPTTLHVTISPHGGLDEALQAVMGAIDALGEQEIPSAVVERLEWLAQDDAVVAQALLTQIAKREGEVAVERLEEQLRQLLALAWEHQDKVVTATRTVALPGITVHVTVSQLAPITARKVPMNDNRGGSSENNPVPLPRRDDDQTRRDVAPIQHPKDLLSEALRRIAPQKQEQIVEKVAEEVARIEVKRHEGHADAEMAAHKVEQAAQAATRLAGTEFEVKAEHRSEHGSVQVTVRNKRPTLAQRAGCFVATACYGDYSHPAVVVLRRFRDQCLRESAVGRAFIAWYYSAGPRFARFIANRPAFRLAGRLLLWPIVVVALGLVWLRSRLGRGVAGRRRRGSIHSPPEHRVQ